uniref:Uncharacterized protein n=1 Tax=Arundo donax TaxID=35708 RepID=A0A0A9DJR4_ARUDO
MNNMIRVNHACYMMSTNNWLGSAISHHFAPQQASPTNKPLSCPSPTGQKLDIAPNKSLANTSIGLTGQDLVQYMQRRFSSCKGKCGHSAPVVSFSSTALSFW